MHLSPVSPPSAFLLPAPQASYAPAPTSKDPAAQLKRTTEWRWIDADWSIKLSTPEARRRNDAAALKEQQSGGALSRMLSGSPAGHGRRQSDASASASPTRGANGPPASPLRAPGETIDAEGADLPSAGLADDDDELGPDWDVDNEGWQYSDNAWQKASRAPKMGRCAWRWARRRRR